MDDFFSPLCDNEIFICSFCCQCVPGGGCRGFGVKQSWGQILVRPAPNWGPRASHLPFWPLFSHPYNGDKRPSLQSTARTVGTQLSASLGASHPRVVATCPASRGNSGRPHVPDASAGRAPGPPPTSPPRPTARLPWRPEGRHRSRRRARAAGPGSGARAAGAGRARGGAGRALRAVRPAAAASSPPARAPARPGRPGGRPCAAPRGWGRASRALERRPGGRRGAPGGARAAPLRWPRG